MSLDAWLTLIVLGACLGTLIFTRLGTDITLIAGLVVLLVAGVVDPQTAFSGFANTGMLTVAVMYIIAAGLRETSALHIISKYVFGRPRSIRLAQARMMLPTAFMSAFVNNTPVVATFLPAVIDWAKQQRIAISKLAMPLSYAAILGGTCTLIGTSTNLIVNGMLLENTATDGFGFFELAWVGIPCALVGLSYVLLAGRWLLPEIGDDAEPLADAREYTVEMMVSPNSALSGQTIEAAGLRHLPGLFLIEIEREGRIIVAASPTETLQTGDRLVFAGVVESITDLQKIPGLTPATNQVFKLDAPRPQRSLIEVVISRSSPIVGKTIRAARFRHLYKAVVIAVSRDGERLPGKIGDITIHAGDMLLVETDATFTERYRNSRDFLLLHPLEGARIPHFERGWIAWLILAGVVITATTGLLDMLTASLVGAGLMLLTRCCSANVARRSIDLEVLIVIAASLGIGQALQQSGAAATIASTLLPDAGAQSWVLLAGIYLLTLLLTEMITNNGAAVLMFPVAQALALKMGLNFMPFAVAITVAASAAFATPFGYQTHLMVYGPGGYRFGDFLRFGVPLNVIVAATAIGIIPLVWPLQG